MIDINELRRKLNSGDIVDHIDLHANIKTLLSEMIDRLEAAEKEVALKERVIDTLGSELNAVAKERDNLRAKIEAMEKQEPVAQVGVHKTGGNAGIAWSARPLNDFDSLPLLREGDRLYLAPGAQSAPSVPDDGFKRAVMEIKDVGYGAIFKHLICERAAELAAAPEAKP